MRLLLPVALALITLGCGGGRTRTDGGLPPGGDGSITGALTIEPADAILPSDGKQPASLTYKVSRDGADVTAQATLWVQDGRIGGFSGNVFSSSPGGAGKTFVYAKLGELMAQTTLTVRVTTVVVAPGTPADAPSRFGGADDPSRAPALVYPGDGALLPPNIVEVEVHFLPKNNQLFELSFVGDTMDVRIYTTCPAAGGGCAFEPSEATWKTISGGGRGQSLQVSLRGTSMQGGPVGSAAPRTLSFADEDMLGGLYYWAASSGGIYRYEFGRRRQQAEAFYTPVQAGAMCAGCHALSRNGKRIGVGLNIPAPSAMRILDVATRKKTYEVPGGVPGQGSNYQAFTPDGDKIITTEGGGLTVRQAATGALLGKSPAVENANMPDVSHDGALVVFARGVPTCQLGFCNTLSSQQAGLFLIPFLGQGFGAPRTLVPSGVQNNYYPSFAPKSDFIVFNRAQGDSYDAKDAKVMIVPTAGGLPIDLKSVNDQLGNSWPKFSPFLHHFRGRTINWITYSSRRDYGVRRLGGQGGAVAQLWMVPVEVEKLKAGQDPAFPPFWLPFQDKATGNHIAQWVEKVERAPCSQVDQSGCMAGEVCQNGVCVPQIQ